ncbi:MAG: hypothetical protein ACHQ53_04765 [Polyangiales bacterium]
MDAMRTVMLVVLVLVALTACKKSGGGMVIGGAGGTSAGSGGTSAGSGGAVVGTGGTSMASGGSGAAGQGGGGQTVAGCSAAMTTAAPSALHMAAHDVLAAATPCGFSSCHMGSNARAHLDLLDAANLKTALVGKPACEAPNLSIIDGSGGDAALAKSYMWIKLTGAVDLSAQIVGNMAWGTPGDCGQMGPTQPYGDRMPLTNTDMLLDDTRLGAIRNWICAGAPGP